MKTLKYFKQPATCSFVIALALSLVACTSTNTLAPKAEATLSKAELAKFAYKVGDKGPAGGWIFFVDYFNEYPSFDYLEAAPNAISSGIAWATSTVTCYDDVDKATDCQAGSVYPNADRDKNQQRANAVGMGEANTKVIIARHDAGSVPRTNYAAGLADSYSSKVGSVTFDDWFLPSAEEEKLMYSNLEQAGVVQFPAYDAWSSTEVEDDSVWYPEYFSAMRTGANKFFANSVRAVRAF